MKAIDIKKCIGKQVIMLDHSVRVNPESKESSFDSKYKDSLFQNTVSILKESPSGEWVFVHIKKEILVDVSQHPPFPSFEEWIDTPLREAFDLLKERKATFKTSSHRCSIYPTWIHVSYFNEDGMEIIPGELPPKRFSIVEIVS